MPQDLDKIWTFSWPGYDCAMSGDIDTSDHCGGGLACGLTWAPRPSSAPVGFCVSVSAKAMVPVRRKLEVPCGVGCFGLSLVPGCVFLLGFAAFVVVCYASMPIAVSAALKKLEI